VIGVGVPVVPPVFAPFPVFVGPVPFIP